MIPCVECGVLCLWANTPSRKQRKPGCYGRQRPCPRPRVCSPGSQHRSRAAWRLPSCILLVLRIQESFLIVLVHLLDRGVQSEDAVFLLVFLVPFVEAFQRRVEWLL